MKILLNADLKGKDQHFRGKVMAVDKKFLLARAGVLRNICRQHANTRNIEPIHETLAAKEETI